MKAIMARKRDSNPISLFAFQDIITAVMGVIILIVLLLSLCLVQLPDTSGSGDVSDLLAVANVELIKLEQKKKQLRS